MTGHSAEPRAAANEPAAGDVVLRRDGPAVTLSQAPGLPQFTCAGFAEAVVVATAFAAAHAVGVWYATGRHWHLVATFRPRLTPENGPETHGRVPDRTPGDTPRSPSRLTTPL